MPIDTFRAGREKWVSLKKRENETKPFWSQSLHTATVEVHPVAVSHQSREAGTCLWLCSLPAVAPTHPWGGGQSQLWQDEGRGMTQMEKVVESRKPSPEQQAARAHVRPHGRQ